MRVLVFQASCKPKFKIKLGPQVWLKILDDRELGNESGTIRDTILKYMSKVKRRSTTKVGIRVMEC